MNTLAQAETLSKLVDRTTDSAADYGLVGVLLVLCLVGVGFALWMFGRFLARRDDLERASREGFADDERQARHKAETAFLSELKEHRDMFDKQLTEQRKQGLALAQSGQLAVTALSEAFHELALAIASDNAGVPLTQSGVLKRRQERKRQLESVLE